jgi:predicted nuclease of predicted toxin-antitoxin system
MNFKLDENLHPENGDLFRGQGHDVVTVYDQNLRGHEDLEIAEVCRQEGRILLSFDLDFSNITLFPPENYTGLIVLRLRAKGRKAVRRVLGKVLIHLDIEPVAGRLWIVDDQRIRIHRLRDDEP